MSPNLRSHKMSDRKFGDFKTFRYNKQVTPPGIKAYQQNAIKVPHRYYVQVSDTTMMTIAAALPGQ